MNKKKALLALYNEDGTRRLQTSYAQIAKSINLSDTHVRRCLNPNVPDWNVRVFRRALAVLKEEAIAERKLNEEIAAVIAAIEK